MNILIAPSCHCTMAMEDLRVVNIKYRRVTWEYYVENPTKVIRHKPGARMPAPDFNWAILLFTFSRKHVRATIVVAHCSTVAKEGSHYPN